MSDEVVIKLREYRFWSPHLGEQALRISCYNSHGHEYFTIQPACRGKALRELRQRWAEKFYDAIQLGQDPGEVR